MKKIIFLGMLLFSFFVRAAFWAGTDIPLLDDFVVDENEGFSFDTPAGQILTISGSTKSSASSVKTFYKDSLTALGWTQKSATTYKRDQDELTLQLDSTTKGKTTVKLQITFANK